MPDLHPLIWALIFVVLLIALFEVVRLGKLSGTISIAGGFSIVGLLDYVEALELTAFMGEKSLALMMLIFGIFKGYARWRTGDVVREAPHIMGSGDGSRSLGTGDGRR